MDMFNVLSVSRVKICMEICMGHILIYFFIGLTIISYKYWYPKIINVV